MRCPLLRLFSAFVALFVSATVLLAQNENKVIRENGKSFILHAVTQGEGFFSIQKKYGVTKEELIEVNKEIATKGLRGGQILKIPIKGEATDANFPQETFHTIAKGESVMGITKRYKITVEQLFDWNSDLSASTFTIGRTVRVASPIMTTKASSSIVAKYIVQPQETLYGLSKRFGLTVEELSSANANITTVNVGQELIIPEAKKERVQALVPLTEAKLIEPVVESYQVFRNKSDKAVSVALLFPLGLDSKGDSEMGKRLIDFYRGFILAADSVRKTGIEISISFYDIGSGTSKVDSIIQTGELNQVDVIIAPSHSDQIDKIVAFGQAHDIWVTLPFSSKGESVNANTKVMQMNPPVNVQNNIIFQHWKQRYDNANFIFLSTKGLAGEKTDFVQAAKKTLKSEGGTYKQFTHHIDSVLDIQKLLDPTAVNVLVSDFASIRNLKTILLDLQMIAKQQPDTQLILWGYPEWQTFFLEFGDAYFDLNVHLFTTFYADYSNLDLKRVETYYKNIYQRNMLNTYPRFGLLGYDMGLYLLSGRYENKESMQGLQSGFKFKRFDRNKGGLINHNLFVVEYTKDLTIKRLSISEN